MASWLLRSLHIHTDCQTSLVLLPVAVFLLVCYVDMWWGVNQVQKCQSAAERGDQEKCRLGILCQRRQLGDVSTVWQVCEAVERKHVEPHSTLEMCSLWTLWDHETRRRTTQDAEPWNESCMSLNVYSHISVRIVLRPQSWGHLIQSKVKQSHTHAVCAPWLWEQGYSIYFRPIFTSECTKNVWLLGSALVQISQMASRGGSPERETARGW